MKFVAPVSRRLFIRVFTLLFSGLLSVLYASVVNASSELQVGFLMLPGVYNTELMAPYDVFHHTCFHASPAMHVFTISRDGGRVKTFEGLLIDSDYSIKNAPAIDVLVIPSAEHNMDSDLRDEELKAWIRKTANSARYVVTLCDGAFMLANTGLLEKKNATTFPTDVGKFKSLFPAVYTLEGYSFVHDGKFLTSQGGAKSYDVAMYLVDMIYGEKVAQEIGQGLVIHWKNPQLRFFVTAKTESRN